MLLLERVLSIEIQPIKRREPEFHQRFDNWRRWCLQKGLHQGRTGSIEGFYRSPQCWDPPEPRPPAIDLPDAIMVNRAYMYLAQLAPKQANIIKILTFRPHWRPQWQAQKLGIHYTRLDEALDAAKIMLKNQLRRLG